AYRIAYQVGSVAPTSCSAGTPISERAIVGTSHEGSRLAPDMLHGFRVCSVGTGGNTVSAIVTASAKTERRRPPHEPTGESTSALTPSSVTLAWSSGGGSTSGYFVSYRAGNTPPASCEEGTKLPGPILTTSLEVTGLTHETQYS